MISRLLRAARTRIDLSQGEEHHNLSDSGAMCRSIGKSRRKMHLVRRLRKAARTMAARQYDLSKVYQLLEPGPVVMLATARKGRSNVMTMS